MPHKILFLQHSANLGGAPKSLYQLISLFKENAYDCELLVLGDGPNRGLFANLPIQMSFVKWSYIFHGSTVSPTGTFNVMRNLISIFVALFIVLRTSIFGKRFDIVYLNSSSLCFYGLFFKYFTRSKVIYHLREPLRNTFIGRVVKVVVGWSQDNLIAISKVEAAQFAQYYSVVAPNYLDVGVFFPEYLKKVDAGDKQDILKIGYFGRVTEENGISVFLEIADYLTIKSGVNFDFHVFGISGNESHQIKKMIDANKSTVTFHKMVEIAEPFMQECDVILVPFTEPHFSRVQIEAMTLGKLVICSDVEPLNSFVSNESNGYLCNPCDVSNWCETLLRVYNNRSLINELGAQASSEMRLQAQISKENIINAVKSIT